MTRFLNGSSHGTHAIESAVDRPLVVNLKKSQVWMPISLNFPWLHGSWLIRKLLPADYSQTLGPENDVKDSMLRLMAQHDEDPERDAYPSVYGHLRNATAKGRKALSRNSIASELFDHLKVGQQTTASTLTFLVWRLSRHPEWQTHLQRELASLGPQKDGIPAYGIVNKCPVLDALVRETLRVHPAASGRGERIVPSGGRRYSGIYIPAGTIVTGPILVLHRNESVFEDPSTWEPERWMRAEVEKLKHMERSFAPFGYGARVCIGRHLALMEMKLLVAGLFMRFGTRLGESCTDTNMEQLGTFTAVPRGLRCELYVDDQRTCY